MELWGTLDQPNQSEGPEYKAHRCQNIIIIWRRLKDVSTGVQWRRADVSKNDPNGPVTGTNCHD